MPASGPEILRTSKNDNTSAPKENNSPTRLELQVLTPNILKTARDRSVTVDFRKKTKRLSRYGLKSPVSEYWRAKSGVLRRIGVNVGGESTIRQAGRHQAHKLLIHQPTPSSMRTTISSTTCRQPNFRKTSVKELPDRVGDKFHLFVGHFRVYRQ